MHYKQLLMIPKQLEGIPICEAYDTQTGAQHNATGQGHCTDRQPQCCKHSPWPTKSIISQSVHAHYLQDMSRATEG